MTLGFQLLTCFCVTILQQLMASKSDAPFRDAKAKLMEIRAKYFTVTGKKSDAKERKSKRRKKSNQSGSTVLLFRSFRSSAVHTPSSSHLQVTIWKSDLQLVFQILKQQYHIDFFFCRQLKSVIDLSFCCHLYEKEMHTHWKWETRGFWDALPVSLWPWLLAAVGDASNVSTLPEGFGHLACLVLGLKFLYLM